MRQKFIEMVSSKVGCGYVWGSQGQILTTYELQKLCTWFGREHYYLPDGTQASKWMDKQVFDCSGLIVWALTEMGSISADYNTDGLLGLCDRLGSREELQAGDLVFAGDGSKTWHVGIYVGNGYVVQAMSTAAGVVKTTWQQYNSWNMYGRLRCLEGDSIKVLTQGNKGAAVIDLQQKLLQLGYSLNVDGDYGPGTLGIVKQFQVDNGLESDGIAGPKTLALISEKSAQKSPIEITVDAMAASGAIIDKAYWSAVLNGQKSADPVWLKKVIDKLLG